jgi:protein ImuB
MRVRRWTHEMWIHGPAPLGGARGAVSLKTNSRAATNPPQSFSDEPPLVLVRSVASRQIIVAVDESARARGIRPGMTLSEARAIYASIVHAEHDPHRDAIALEALGRWMMKFSPVVSPSPLAGEGRGEGRSAASHNQRGSRSGNFTPHPNPLPQGERGPEMHGLFLDVTGCQRVFRGLENLMHLVDEALKKLRITARLAIAPTPGAAWALALFGKQNGCIIGYELKGALENLPPIALRIEPEIAEALHHLGLNTIGQVMRLPRQSLPARFGDQLLLRIDQALGRVPEPLTPLEPFSPITARMDFEGPIDSLETIWLVLKELLAKIVRELAKRGRGARELQAEFFRAYEMPVIKTIQLSRPSRDAVNLFNLLRCAMETLEEIQPRRHQDTKKRKTKISSLVPWCLGGFPDYERFIPDGFMGIRLTISRSERIADEQIALLAHEEFAGQIELDHLIERLCARAGKDVISQAEIVESHLPERSWHGRPARGSEFKKKEITGEPPVPQKIRPLNLLRCPREIRVMVSPSDDQEGGRPVSMTLNDAFHRFEQVVGPERIAGIWWEGHHKTRDYFEVEDQCGKRFWIFRVLQTTRWFIHGRFE